ncbi:MAG: hypothetical protein KUG61_00415 [Parvibaculaceae bacterium]|nr:hypothetical protein [Parvibaculaceae bacterium]
MPKLNLDTPDHPYEAIKAILPTRSLPVIAAHYRKLGALEILLEEMDEQDFHPLLAVLHGLRAQMVNEALYRAPANPAENLARLHITLDHSLTNGSVTELVS